MGTSSIKIIIIIIIIIIIVCTVEMIAGQQQMECAAMCSLYIFVLLSVGSWCYRLLCL